MSASGEWSADQLLAGVAVDQLGGLARARERERLAAGFDRFDQPGDGIVVGTAAGERIVAERRGIPQREVFAAARRAVVVDHFDVAADQARGQLARIGDRRAGGQKHGPRAVVFADPHQAAEHGRHVGTQDAAIRVDFVDHDVAQFGKERGPLRMVRQDRGVQHVGVREHEIGLAANAAALRGGRVAVVHAGANGSS